MEEAAREQTEKWFVDRGVPHFIEAYNASEDVLTRALPILILFFLFSSISAIDLDWPAWEIVTASLAGLAILLGVWAGINRLRGLRPLLRRPDRVGPVEIGVFLGVPTLLPIIFGWDWSGALITLLSQTVILGLVFAITSYGVVAISWWVLGQLVHSIGQTLRLFTRTLPLLLIGFMFLFLNAEAWQSAGRLDAALLVSVGLLLAALAGVFLGTQVPREIRDQNTFASWDEIDALCDDAPGEPIGGAGTPRSRPLSRRERGNLWLLVFISQSFRLILVSALIGAFFVGLGLLIIQPDTVKLWTAGDATVLWETELFGIGLQLSAELLRVSGFLASFALMYFAVYTTTESALREEFYEDIIDEVRQNLAVRTRYLETLRVDDREP
ncbi:MAG: hypothetical protein QNJ75_00070 [Acidimicrobiia bacterium]|nr:hypothetical protein [Acidimicrobiia bacterium]